MFFLFEIVIPDAPGGLQPALEVVTVAAFLADDIIIYAFPLFQQTHSFGFVVDRKALVGLFSPHEAPPFREDKHRLGIARVANVNPIIMHDSSDPASAYASDLLIAYLQLLLVNLKKVILQLFVTPCDGLL